MDNKELANLRREYQLGRLNRADLTNNPMVLLESWLEDARAAQIPDPNAFVLGTVSSQGQVSQRIVLMKNLNQEEGALNFFTNYHSQKATEIANNPKVSILFPWYMLERQVIATGIATKLDKAESMAYFYNRPKASQIAAIASEQSTILASKESLLERYHALTSEYADTQVPFPDNWGGFHVKLEQIEFWQGAEHRLHDRFRYHRTEYSNTWSSNRVSP